MFFVHKTYPKIMFFLAIVISHHPSVGPSPITLTNFFSATKGMNSMKLHRKLPSMTLQKYNKPFRFNNNNEMADMSFCRKNICSETTKQKFNETL